MYFGCFTRTFYGWFAGWDGLCRCNRLQLCACAFRVTFVSLSFHVCIEKQTLTRTHFISILWKICLCIWLASIRMGKRKRLRFDIVLRSTGIKIFVLFGVHIKWNGLLVFHQSIFSITKKITIQWQINESNDVIVLIKCILYNCPISCIFFHRQICWNYNAVLEKRLYMNTNTCGVAWWDISTA